MYAIQVIAPPIVAATDWMSVSRLRMCANSWAITPRSSLSLRSSVMPCVTATAACFGLRPVAKALGWFAGIM
jgi:hypothetical protein